MKSLNAMHEEALQIILDNYDGNSNREVELEYTQFPKYMEFSLKQISESLTATGLITGSQMYLSGWNMYLTQDGIEYFDAQEALIHGVMTDVLPLNAEELLKVILETDNSIEYLHSRFEDCTDEAEDELRGILGEIEDKGFVKIQWAENEPSYIQIFNSGKTYFERKKSYLLKAKQQSPVTSVYNITATGSNLVWGDITHSELSIDNSICKLEQAIEQKGGAEKEELQQILNEIKDMLENIESIGQVPKNTGLFKRITNHLHKHGWFYAEVVSTIGTAILMKMGGQI